MHQTTLDTAVGPILLEGDESGVHSIRIGVAGENAAAAPAGSPLAEAAHQLEAYFAGEREEFDLELAPSGTPFQQEVWRELRRIPYGETISYAELARRIGRPTASRAVGAANGANPLPIVVPCHRVIGSDGSLTGFAAGTEIKAALLRHEGCDPASQQRLF